MRQVTTYLPVIVFGLWGVYMRVRFGHFERDPAIVRRPEYRAWSTWRFFNDDEWTERGLAVRRKYLQQLFFGFALAIVCIILVSVTAATN